MGDRIMAVGYVRVSTEGQAETGVSLADQEDKIRKYAELYGLDLVAVIRDPGASAKSLDRPGVRRALAMLEAGEVSAIVVTHLDRLTRNVRDLGDLIETYFAEAGGASLLSVEQQIDTRTACGRLILNVLGSVSAWQRETTAERTKSALKHKADRGEYTGGNAPYGFENVGGTLMPNPVEEATQARARALKTEGHSYRAIAQTLAAEGHLPRNGGAWNPNAIARLVAEERAA